MATYSEVKAGLDAIAIIITNSRASLLKCKASATTIAADLDALPTTYADLVATIQAYGTTNAAEANAKAEMAKLSAEFQALSAVADTVATITP